MAQPTVLLIENGERYTPGPSGRSSVLLLREHIVRGAVDRRGLDRLRLEYDVPLETDVRGVTSSARFVAMGSRNHTLIGDDRPSSLASRP